MAAKRVATMRRKNAGFTIVEVMIVLAIAGLILLIVFEAIPTLQRQSRNNQRKQDISTILAAVARYQLENSGNFPLSCGNYPGASYPFTPCDTSDTDPAQPDDYFLKYVANNLTYYTSGEISLYTTPTLSSHEYLGPTSPDEVQVINYQVCNTTAPGKSTGASADYRDFVALYRLESGTGTGVAQCQQL
jgi:prepilin-type N-terminal cleavage/methylation domain-containing protein